MRQPEFPPKWSTRKTLRVGYLLGRGRQATTIAELLNDGTTDNTIRQMRRYGRLKDFGKKKGSRPVPVELTAYEARLLDRQATAMGLTPEEWLRRVAAAAIRDEMYTAIVDEG